MKQLRHPNALGPIAHIRAHCLQLRTLCRLDRRLLVLYGLVRPNRWRHPWHLICYNGFVNQFLWARVRVGSCKLTRGVYIGIVFICVFP